MFSLLLSKFGNSWFFSLYEYVSENREYNAKISFLYLERWWKGNLNLSLWPFLIIYMKVWDFMAWRTAMDFALYLNKPPRSAFFSLTCIYRVARVLHKWRFWLCKSRGWDFCTLLDGQLVCQLYEQMWRRLPCQSLMVLFFNVNSSPSQRNSCTRWQSSWPAGTRDHCGITWLWEC